MSKQSYIAVMSTDSKFMVKLIDWLNEQECEKGSTTIRLHDNDPYEEVDMLRGQIEGMAIRIADLEK